MENNYKKYSFYLMISLLLTLVGTFIGSYFVNSASINVIIILSFVLIFAFLFTKGTIKKIIFFIFCLGEGITLTPILYYYTGANLMWCLVLTVLITGIFLIIGFKAKNLGFLGGILSVSLIGLILYMFIGIFVPLPSLALIGVVVFCGYISYDINMFKRRVEYGVSDDEILEHVMNMYLDILNLLLYILRLFGKSDD